MENPKSKDRIKKYFIFEKSADFLNVKYFFQESDFGSESETLVFCRSKEKESSESKSEEKESSESESEEKESSESESEEKESSESGNHSGSSSESGSESNSE